MSQANEFTSYVRASNRGAGNSGALMSDEYLDFWGNFFVENRFHERGVLFSVFIQHPRDIALAMTFRPRINAQDDFRPLLPAQVRAITKPNARASENFCIGCGCTDTCVCLTAHGVCHWLRLDAGRGIGVCSECQALVAAYDAAREAGSIPRKTPAQALAAAGREA